MAKKHDEISARFAAKIVFKPANWLKPYDRNSRTHTADQVAQIAASIDTFGFVNPILARGDGTIIAGHGRLEAATTMLGMDEVPVIILDHLSDAQARLLVIADNKIAENAGWDEDLLAQELMDLETALDAEGIDLSISGFTDEEIDDLLGHVEEENEVPKVEDAESPEFQQVTFTLHKDQMAVVKAALRAAQNVGEFTDGLNENSNGNALARIAGYYNEGNREFIPRSAGEEKRGGRVEEKTCGQKGAGEKGETKSEEINAMR